MTTERIKGIQKTTGYPDSISVQQALLQVWKEVAQESVPLNGLVMQKTADIDFLVSRTMKAGTCNFTDERDTGSSSNSIVAIAYGMQKLKDQILPGDMSDLNACRNMWKKLPEHRKTAEAIKAMENAENFRENR